MAQSDEHLAELLKLPAEQRARAARALLYSLDDEAEEPDALEAQAEELLRRVRAFAAGEVKLVGGEEARATVMARIRSLRRS
ncbi:MAG: addiction module protein [Deltaproteobacteria bacterium]|nr:addiction module protein [Deltaproteobacteria bacterium]